MSMRTFWASIGGLVGIGAFIGYLGAAKPIGGDISDNKALLRTQWARSEAIRSGMSEEEAKKIGHIETKGGDKGFRYTGKNKAD